MAVSREVQCSLILKRFCPWRCCSISLQWYLHSSRTDIKASRLKTCCMLAYRLSPWLLQWSSKPGFKCLIWFLSSHSPLTAFFQSQGCVVESRKKGVVWCWECNRRQRETCGKEKHAERKRQEKWQSGILERGDGKERKDERPEKVRTWKRRQEPQQAHIGENEAHPFTKHNSISFSISSCSLNVDILQLSFPGSRMLCFLPVFDKGDHGGWSSVDPGASLSLMEECCCLLQPYSHPVGNTSLGFPQLASCYIKAASPFRAYLHFPVALLTHSELKNKVGLIFPQCMIRLKRAAFLQCHRCT